MNNTNYSQLRKDGKLCGTIKAAKEKRGKRDMSQFVADRPKRVIDRTVLINAGPTLVHAARDRVMSIHSQKSNWEPGVEEDRSSTVATIKTIDNGRYSSRCTFTHYTYSVCVRSCGRVTRNRLVALIGDKRIKMTAPAGWCFGCDEYGLYVVRKRREHTPRFRYHFNSDNLASKSALRNAGIAHERFLIETTKEKQLSARHRRLAIEAGVFVGYQDSRAAGNCHAGTVQWFRSHELNIYKHYPLSVAKSFGDSQFGAVHRTIEAAIVRTVKELKAGFCSLAKIAK
jgi:hypothetical protein